MTEVLPGLLLGDVEDSRAQRPLSLLVNCTVELPFVNALAEHQERVPLYDPPSAPEHAATLLNCLLAGGLFARIDAALAAGRAPVLVHCFAGAQRSAAVCAAYVMHKFPGLPVADACAYLRRRRPVVFGGLDGTMQVNYYRVLVVYREYRLAAEEPQGPQPPSGSGQVEIKQEDPSSSSV